MSMMKTTTRSKPKPGSRSHSRSRTADRGRSFPQDDMFQTYAVGNWDLYWCVRGVDLRRLFR